MQIDAHNLSMTMGYRTLFSALSFELDAGQCLLVEGENGAGKTTLLKALVGLKPIELGELVVPVELKKVWLGHQNPLKANLSALENLTNLVALHSVGELSYQQALSQVGLAYHAGQLVKTFSAGMKRRLVLASLLMIDADVWVLDEPQTALDKQGIAMFESMVTVFLQQGGRVIMTSHHPVNLTGVPLKKLNLSEFK